MHYKGIAYALILVIVIAFAIALWSKSAINQPVLKETSFNNAYYKFAINASPNLSSTATVLVVDGVRYQSTQLPYTFIFGLGTRHNYSFAQNVSASSGNVVYAFNYISGCSFQLRASKFNSSNNCTATAYYIKRLNGTTATAKTTTLQQTTIASPYTTSIIPASTVPAASQSASTTAKQCRLFFIICWIKG